MKIKVVKAQHGALWYATRIGETFDNVEKLNDEYYSYVTLINNGKHFFVAEDVEVVSDEQPKFPFKVECIANDGWENYLTIGEVYTATGDNRGLDYFLEGVVGAMGSFKKSRFKIVNGEGGQEAEQKSSNKYMREIKKGVWADVYDVLRAWEVTDPCLQHLLKKALQPGKRHHKDLEEDLQDILASAKRAVEMFEEWKE